ncbi:DEAD/DEAH box helicase family protein [Pediococcus acidilactici]
MYNKTLKWRKSQATLMNYVYQQFSQENEERNIVVEAPTGMGKTLGYLLPLSYVGRQRA